MNHSKACAAWTAQCKGTGSRLHSDGESLWSYHWYEIARHVGKNVVYIRHDGESYSTSTRRHINCAISAARDAGLIVLQARGHRDDDCRESKLGQPDWDWIKWVRWFAKNWRTWDKKFYVLVNPSLVFRGDGVMTQARNSQCPVHLESLIEAEPDRGVLTFEFEQSISYITLKGGIHITKRARYPHGSVWRYVSLNKLLKADPPTPLSQVVALPFRKMIAGPSWQSILFSDSLGRTVRPDDMRKTLALDERAFKHGSPGFAKHSGLTA